jgi:SAM-dependent methyltransferase
VCCDANAPLPFARASFDLVGCTDAFHYIWQRRLLASEMARLASSGGLVVLGHVHNARVENPSAGMPLDPAGYRRLFAPLETRLFRDGDLLRSALARAAVDLSGTASDDDVAGEAALAVIASADAGAFRRYPSTRAAAHALLGVNPLYGVEAEGDEMRLTLRFPSTEYEDEFAGCQAYLPPRVALSRQQYDDLVNGRDAGPDRTAGLRHVFIDLPEAYLAPRDA